MNTRTSVSARELPVPSFFKSKNAEDWNYSPNTQLLFEKAQDWRKKHAILPAGAQKTNIHLLIIDAQKDFCYPQGTLYVAGRSGRGAIDDNIRTAEFIYRNLGIVKNITTTFDTHFAFQLFFASMWVDENNQYLSAHTLIRLSDDGRRLVNTDPAGNLLHEDVKPDPRVAWFICNGNYNWLFAQLKFYCAQLASGGKYTLYLWPYHCLLGSDGHALVGVVHEARMFFSFVRGSQSWAEVKGGHPLTENYSVISPEVLLRHDSLPLSQKNEKFIRTLVESDIVIIAGQAKSHCVRSSIDDLRREISVQDPKLASKVYVVTDLMSTVTVPDGKGGFIVDFTDDADKAFAEFERAGMHLVKSTDPIETWPGVSL